MSNPSLPRDDAFVAEQDKDAKQKSLAKLRGERYYLRAKWWFDCGRYHSAAWLCRVGLRLSTGPFMLAVRDQLDDMAANCDQHLDASGLSHAKHLCSIEITIRGTKTPTRYLAKLTIDEIVEVELQLFELANTGRLKRFIVSTREPLENLGELLVWLNHDVIRRRQTTDETRSTIDKLVSLQIDEAAEYHDGLVTFPTFMYESLKAALGIEFEPEYLDTTAADTGELLHKRSGQ